VSTQPGDGKLLQGCPQGVDLDDVLVGVRGDERPLVRGRDDEAFLFEGEQRLPDRRSADVKLLGELAFAERLGMSL